MSDLSLEDIIQDLPQPAYRALVNEGIRSVAMLCEYSERELLELHGFGLKGLNLLKIELEKNNLNLK